MIKLTLVKKLPAIIFTVFIIWLLYFVYFENGLANINIPNLGYVIPLTFFVFGAYFLFTSIWKISLGLSSRSWLNTKGTIISSEIVIDHGSYISKIQYSFEVVGKVYTSYSISAAPNWWYWGNLKSIAENRVAKYPVNSVIDVYYKPEAPEKSLLEPGVYIFSILIGIGLFIFTTILTYFIILRIK